LLQTCQCHGEEPENSNVDMIVVIFLEPLSVRFVLTVL
jgi:hypothetical protein